MESQEGQEGQEGIADNKAAWFAVKVALGGLTVSYVLGPVVAIVFLAGWWFGVRNLPEPEEGKRP